MRPRVVEGGQAALRALREAREAGAPFPLMLVDSKMPGMDGFSLVEKIRGTPDLAAATIMMLSSSRQSNDAARCRELGIGSHLTKPVKQSELFNVITNLFRLPSQAGIGEAAGEQAEVETHAAELRPVVLPEPLPEEKTTYHILLAEDNAVNWRLAVRLLEKEGHCVVVAHNGLEAVAAFESRTFDLILMDMQMPEMNGYEATAAIRERERTLGGHIPIIAMTANAMKGDRERCLEAGLDGYISKPIKTKELFAAIEQMAPPRSKTEAQFTLCDQWPHRLTNRPSASE
jgi:CheY-like chemotaxis protein